MTRKKVVIAGGGVAGLSAAHMLACRGFDVEVYEYHEIPGGKARSTYVRGSGKDGRRDLPSEHGFRFFPGAYRHVINTMEQIPYWDTDEKVIDRLTIVHKEALVSFTHRANIMPANMPSTLWGLIKLWRQMRSQPRVVFGKGELRFYFLRLWQILTSCHERRDDQYEQIPWWEFVGAENRTINYQKYLANISRTLVAADPKKVSTRTNGNTWIQTLMGMWGTNGDRVLDGPTNEVWIYPWIKFLLSKGVKYHINSDAIEFTTNNNEVTGLRVTPSEVGGAEPPRKITRILDCDRYGITESEVVDDPSIVARGDYYVSAVPVERMAEILNEGKKTNSDSNLTALDPQLEYLEQLKYSVQWMNGIQFYLKPTTSSGEVPYLPGHHIHADAPFALTSIFQTHYWKNIDLTTYGDGTVQSICSVDISDWSDAPGRIYDEFAVNLKREQVFDEVWADIKCGFRHDSESKIEDDNLVNWSLDSDITSIDMRLLKNREPLLVNRVNTWRLRPEATTNVRNLFLASDYVRTNIDLATMEGANEAARRAVNGLLDAEDSKEPRCRIWPMEEPEFLTPFREYDLECYRLGQEWSNKFPWRIKIGFYWYVLKNLLGFGKKS